MNKKKVLQVNLKRIFLVYSIGFATALFMPKKYFMFIMGKHYERINNNLEVIEKNDYYKVI